MNTISENSGIYQIINQVDGKFYIGSAICLKKRWFHHRKLLRKSSHFNSHMQSAWNKYGEPSFYFKVIEECLKSDLVLREQYYLDLYFKNNDIYNLNPTAYSQLGSKRSEATKLKMSLAAKGREFTEEHKKSLSIAWHSSEKSKIQNATARNLATQACIGRVESNETRLKKSNSHLGKKQAPHSEETKAKISLTNRLNFKNSLAQALTWPLG